MMGPLPTIVREVEGTTRAVYWHFKFVMNGVVERGRRGSTIVQGFVVIVNLYPLCSKLGDLLVDSRPTADVGHNVLECGMVDRILIWTNDLCDRLTLALEWHLGGHVDMEVFLDDVAFPLDIGDRDDITLIGGLSHPPLCFVCDDNVNGACPPLGGVLLSNPVARVKETGAGRANGSNSAKLLRRHHRLV